MSHNRYNPFSATLLVLLGLGSLTGCQSCHWLQRPFSAACAFSFTRVDPTQEFTAAERSLPADSSMTPPENQSENSLQLSAQAASEAAVGAEASPASDSTPVDSTAVELTQADWQEPSVAGVRSSSILEAAATVPVIVPVTAPVTAPTGSATAEPSGQGESSEQGGAEQPGESTATENWQTENEFPINLPTALAMIGGDHPVVGQARWQVQEAYARLEQAEILWLPSIQPGFSFRKRDGNYQDVGGAIVDVNLNSFQYGLGAGAVGAGTFPRPGLVAQFHLADAIFEPQIAQKMAWARGHRAQAVLNEQLLQVAIAYLDLLSAVQEQRIYEQNRELTASLSELTAGFARTGQGLQADADRLQTELILAENRLIGSEEQVGVAAARLAQQLSLRHHGTLKAMDVTVLPLEMVTDEIDRFSLVSMALSQRPEMRESQVLVAAALEEYKRQKYSPFVPSLLLGYSTGGFGGGNGNTLANIDARHDFDAIVSWEVRHLGFGEAAARREANSRIEQSKFEKIRMMDQITREVAEAHEQVRHRRRQIQTTQAAIQVAEDSYNRNLARIREAQGIPLEVLQSLRALEEARRAYLKAVVDYNQAQFRLQWALGWQISAS